MHGGAERRRERFRSIRIVSLRNGTSLVGNIEIVRGTFFPRPPLEVCASTASGPKHCFDESVERAIRFVVKRGHAGDARGAVQV